MTSVLAPAANITLQGIAPDVIQSCVLAPPPPTPAPEPEDVIYAPVAPGITYGSLPVITTGTTPGNLVIVDTSPDQIIGCANDVGTDPQSRLDALFPSAVDGDGVVDRATNDIWVYDGATWNNVGPTPGPTLTVNSTIPPWNEIVVYDARVRTRLEVNGLAYALELLTEPAAYGITLGLTVQTSQALVRVPAADQSFAVQLPAVSSGGSVLPPAAATTLAAPVPQVSSGGSVAVPLADISFAASVVPYVGTGATVVQPPDATASLLALPPAVASGASVAVPAADTTLAAATPAFSNPIIFEALSFTGAGGVQNTTLRAGYSFTVGASNLTVNTLSVYVPFTGGLELVIIHRNSDDAVMVSQTVARVAGTWSTQSISPITLQAGQAYTISSADNAGFVTGRGVYRNHTGVTYYAGITVTDDTVISFDNNRPTDLGGSLYRFMRFGFQ